MNINATFFVQIFNFFIVYLMLRLFLFKPVIEIIEEEEVHENTLITAITQQQKSFEIQEKERQRHWYVCQEYFNNQRPYFAKEPLPLPSIDENNTLLLSFMSDEDIAHIITDISGIIKEKIQHDIH
ncbi:MAG TPA: hypothetical protein VLB80_03585 [Candidatus Babeliales bacterium]|nr:hypothetical protein [Candidatus Babeliales bacterium]